MVMAVRAATLLSRAVPKVAKSNALVNLSRSSSLAANFSTKYTQQHEYISLDGAEATVGITDFAQNQLGDVVFVDLPSIGDAFKKEEAFGAVESVKAASDVYAPAGGKVTGINEELAENPHLVNEDPEGEGWFMKIQVDDASELEGLMDEKAYAEFCENEDH